VRRAMLLSILLAAAPFHARAAGGAAMQNLNPRVYEMWLDIHG
jgi:hypothetical protein